MTLRLPNELIAEIIGFIPYKERYELDGEPDCYDFLNRPRDGILFSSKALSVPYVKLLRTKLEKRHIELIKWSTEMRKLLNGEIKFREAFDKTRHRFYLAGEVGWYWDLPRKNEEILCCICFNWGKDKKEFELCEKGRAHTLHKECLKSFPHCLICSPLYDQM